MSLKSNNLQIGLTISKRDAVIELNAEPRADRGPQAGSPLGVVDATGCQH
jgi:hypothetical protein